MKRILTTLAGCCISATVANAQPDQFPWFAIPTNPTTSSGTLPSGSADFQYPAQPAQAVPAIKPVPLPPVEFDRPPGGQVIVTKWDDYSLIRMICKDVPAAIACSYRTYNTTTGKPISCLIMLGPKAHNDERAIRHEIGHCNGWSGTHEGAR